MIRYINYHQPQGYEIMDSPQQTITVDDSGKRTISVYVDHKIQTASESKSFLRTINLHYPSGAIKIIDQTVLLKRNLYVDQVTNETVYGTWNTGSFDEYLVPTMKGYTASKTTVPTQTVTSDSPSSMTIDIYYTKNA
ncbi:hypothetical protein MOO45_06550 [Bombilactobacillus folatiphilus]|uniref:Mub B2-like domain-containing protein n=1 Tax=Bombilactobacillus folatiphilus TaxID=2923362 RepID=A0ABY4P8J3_9LACO|nr:hypothetical protein [Bombilactobacillus folatiphilus]UQS81849.1 hypothetical protein MOO45_06550 [Bombilactobacillus folatiphilus]